MPKGWIRIPFKGDVMRSTVLILALIGCGNPELESENTDLKAKVEDLEKSEAKLKKKVDRDPFVHTKVKKNIRRPTASWSTTEEAAR